jgi:RecA/RadA recombinase
VDELLGGGFPRGAVSEISGNQSSNRTALTVSILVQAFDAGECCAWIDAAAKNGVSEEVGRGWLVRVASLRKRHSRK